MPKSRTDKSRKQKQIKYKNSKKMSETKAPEMPPFRQVPTWSSTETFEIQGPELEALYNFFNIFAPSFTAVQQVFARGVQSGKIKIGYEYEDGTQIPEDEINSYTQKLNEYFQNRQKQEATASQESNSASLVAEDLTSSPETESKIVNINGYKATPENV